MAFKDHFSERASLYVQARPTYPPALLAELARLAPDRDAAWDCGTGNGQAALGLAEHFAQVTATDPSLAQLAEAPSHPRVNFREGPETGSGLPDASVALVTAAQAAHWFDLDAFYAEALRVLRPGGILALWCYGLCRVTAEIDAPLADFYTRIIGPFWAPERRLVDTGYRTLPFPLPEIPFPDLAIERSWTLEEFTSYVRTWSAVAAYRRHQGRDPVVGLHAELAQLWGGPGAKQKVVWPLSGRLGRKPVGS